MATLWALMPAGTGDTVLMHARVRMGWAALWAQMALVYTGTGDLAGNVTRVQRRQQAVGRAPVLHEQGIELVVCRLPCG